MLKKLIAWYKKRVGENDALRDKMFEEECEPEKQLIEEPEEYIPDISEPVLSFVETFKRTPRRFVVSVEWVHTQHSSSGFFTLTDTETKDRFKALFHKEKYWPERHPCEHWHNYPSFLTQDEWEYILCNLSWYYKERGEKLRSLRAARVTVMQRRERDRLSKIYKGGEDVDS